MPAMTGRSTNIVPFFPFSKEEAAVVGDNICAATSDTIHKSIDNKTKRHQGYMQLEVREDGKLRSLLAKNYKIDEGVRSLDSVVEDKISNAVSKVYRSIDHPFEDGMITLSRTWCQMYD
jgi:ATP-dependent Clp protease ATP-binding subunit ClpA